jgi:hypothetical protein
MNKWYKVFVPSIIGLLVAFLILVLSGLGTSTILNSEGNYVTQTVVSLEVNVFAFVMLLGIFISVFVTGYAMNRKL